ncbi:MAG: hypothetical protein NZM43_11220 [Saprospiraceae bacterium]|nr:hypothetical protein [Saprospiraceae bacterium]MDW8484878.1 hypothetical protein [Saprospiraceae bacterium]
MKNHFSPYIYLRALRHAEHTVFAVQNGQKFYYDPQFGTRMAYSSGQQVKRSIMEELTSLLGEPHAPITFNWEISKENKAQQKEPHSPCDPTYADQLLGGYMKAETGEYVIKRRSPLSISAMRPLHPRLGGLETVSEDATFDRSAHPEQHIIRVSRMEGGKRVELTKEELEEWLISNNRNLPLRNWISGLTRASGLFVYDVAIDLRTLFCVSLNRLEPELTLKTEEKLRQAGWLEGRNAFGPCLICPRERREQLIPALAHALLNWRITSNQSRTFSLMETLAIAISNNANQVAFAIRGELSEDMGDQPGAIPILDENAKAKLFVTPACAGYIAGAKGSIDAIERAEQYLVEQLRAFDYENQH